MALSGFSLDAPFEHVLSVAYRVDNAWKALALSPSGDGFAGDDGVVKAMLRLEGGSRARGGAGGRGFELSFTATRLTRLRLFLAVPGANEPFHLIPSFLFGDNNITRMQPGKAPALTHLHPGEPGCSPSWECRGDRASHPVSIVCFKGGIAGLSIQPYSEGTPAVGSEAGDAFIRNGLVAQLAHGKEPCGVGVTLGYGNLPGTYFAPDKILPTTGHFMREGSARGHIFLRASDDRRDAHGIIREVYGVYHQPARPTMTVMQGAKHLTDAFLNINWHGENAANADGSSFGANSPWMGGRPFRNNFTNMRCGDEAKSQLRAWRTLAEVGWSGGGAIGYPLLLAGARLNNPTALARGVYKLDCVADAANPATGLLFEVSGVEEGKRLNWWWTNPPIVDCHCAYTNASAVYHLLNSHRFALANPGLKIDASRWLKTALGALDTVLSLQTAEGGFGYTYRGDRPEILDVEGFAGAWFIPGLALAYAQTRDAKYLNAGRRALAHYHGWVKNLSCWGTPMDVDKFVDQEGNLGFLRGAVLLHQVTGEDAFLEPARDAANYEYLWRYAIKARPQYRPLRGSPWNSCGGSITSSGTSMHPMGVFIAEELKYLSRVLGDEHHAQRAEDGLNWALNCIEMYPKHTGYGAPGVITERWCPSDGLAMEMYPDGTPASMLFSYNGWAAAAMLEGFLSSNV